MKHDLCKRYIKGRFPIVREPQIIKRNNVFVLWAMVWEHTLETRRNRKMIFWLRIKIAELDVYYFVSFS